MLFINLQSSNYCTIADVIAKLNFEQALCDSNYFMYICKVRCSVNIKLKWGFCLSTIYYR